ncbi:hypothetical protein D3C83_89990 [compost metagenome]
MLFRDHLSVAVPQQRFEDDANRDRQAGDAARTALLELFQGIDGAFAGGPEFDFDLAGVLERHECLKSSKAEFSRR